MTHMERTALTLKSNQCQSQVFVVIAMPTDLLVEPLQLLKEEIMMLQKKQINEIKE